MYASCCGRLHLGAAQAATAEQLMRSRYSAFAVGDAAYLARTWASTTRPPDIRLVPGQRWVGLEIIDTVDGGVLAQRGEVEFLARWERDGQVGQLQERSEFVREDGRWMYLGPIES
jgi:SEC-C motif-containing protein